MKIIEGEDYRIFRIQLRLTEQEEYEGYRIKQAELVVRVEAKGERSMEPLMVYGHRKLSRNRISAYGRLHLGNSSYILEAYLLNCMGEAMIADSRLYKWAGAKCIEDFGLRFQQFPETERTAMLVTNRRLADAEYEKLAAWLNGIKSVEGADADELHTSEGN